MPPAFSWSHVIFYLAVRQLNARHLNKKLEELVPISDSHLISHTSAGSARQGVGDCLREGLAMLNEVPGSELPRAVYRTVALSFVWMMSAAWLAFGGAAGTDVDLFVASLILAVLTVLPALVRKTAMRHLNETAAPSSWETSPSWVDTATGPVTSTQAWVQIATIPVALAAAATLLGLVYSVAGA